MRSHMPQGLTTTAFARTPSAPIPPGGPSSPFHPNHPLGGVSPLQCHVPSKVQDHHSSINASSQQAPMELSLTPAQMLAQQRAAQMAAAAAAAAASSNHQRPLSGPRSTMNGHGTGPTGFGQRPATVNGYAPVPPVAPNAQVHVPAPSTPRVHGGTAAPVIAPTTPAGPHVTAAAGNTLVTRYSIERKNSGSTSTSGSSNCNTRNGTPVRSPILPTQAVSAPPLTPTLATSPPPESKTPPGERRIIWNQFRSSLEEALGRQSKSQSSASDEPFRR